MSHSYLSSFIAAVVLSSAIISPSAYAKGAGSGGGGLKCQAKFEERRNDILDWIEAGAKSVSLGTEPVASALLDFSKTSTNLSDYNSKMRANIELTYTKDQDHSAIGCTENQNEVMWDGKPKTCTATWNDYEPKILCYSGVLQDGKWTGGFMGSSEDDQYWYAHHEFAVLSGLEDQSQERSDYSLSDQLVGGITHTGFIENEVVRKLVIKPNSQRNSGDDANSFITRPGDLPYALVHPKISKTMFVNVTEQNTDCKGNLVAISYNGNIYNGKTFENIEIPVALSEKDPLPLVAMVAACLEDQKQDRETIVSMYIKSSALEENSEKNIQDYFSHNYKATLPGRAAGTVILKTANY
jgi:hypothetical protein